MSAKKSPMLPHGNTRIEEHSSVSPHRLLSWPRYGKVSPCMIPLILSSHTLSIRLSPSLRPHAALFSFVLAASLAHPCGRAFEGSISDTSKGFLALAACFSCSLYACVFLLYNLCIFILVRPYVWSLLFKANIFLLSVCWKRFPRRRQSIHFSTIQGSRCTNPKCTVPSVHSQSQHMFRMLWPCPLLLCLLAVFSLPLCLPLMLMCLYLLLPFALTLSFLFSVCVCSWWLCSTGANTCIWDKGIQRGSGFVWHRWLTFFGCLCLPLSTSVILFFIWFWLHYWHSKFLIFFHGKSFFLHPQIPSFAICITLSFIMNTTTLWPWQVFHTGVKCIEAIVLCASPSHSLSHVTERGHQLLSAPSTINHLCVDLWFFNLKWFYLFNWLVQLLLLIKSWNIF